MSFEKKLAIIKQLIRFGLSGMAAMVTGVILIFVLTDLLKIWYLISSFVAFVGSFLVAFGLQKFWTFQNRQVDTLAKQASLCLLATLFVFVLNMGLMYFFVEKIGLYYIVAQIITYLIIGIIDFCIYKFIIFKA